MGTSRWRPSRVPHVLEGVIAVILGLLLLLQMLSYPATEDPDPDGYVSYAQHLQSTGRLMPDSRRLPGYPAFLALADKLTSRPLERDVYWAQLFLTFLFLLGCWYLIRKYIGALTALIFLGILAAPNYFVRMSVVMLPDAPYTLLWLPIFLTIGWWVLDPDPPGGVLWVIPFGVGLFVLQAIRPTTFPLAVLFGLALAVTVAIRRWRTDAPYGVRARWGLAGNLVRVVTIVAVALLISLLVDRLLDTGARAYGADHVAYRAAIYLPPAGDTPEGQRIEAAKQRFREVEGEPIERARFLTYPTYVFYEEMPRDDVLAVWWNRLRTYPGRYLFTALDDLRHGHYLLARYIVPFFLDLDRTPLFRIYYPHDDGSPAANLFWSTGLILPDRDPHPSNYPFAVETLEAILRMVLVWGLLGLGIWRLGKRALELTLSVVVLCIAFVVVTAATNTVDPRYLLPFAPLAYLAQAAGLTWIARTLVERYPE